MKKQSNPLHSKILEISQSIGPFLVKKDKAYGSATSKSAKCMEMLYPDGIPVDQIQNAYYIQTMLNKFSRIVTDNDPFGESPWLDCTGYCMLAHANHELRRESHGTGKQSSNRKDRA